MCRGRGRTPMVHSNSEIPLDEYCHKLSFTSVAVIKYSDRNQLKVMKGSLWPIFPSYGLCTSM